MLCFRGIQAYSKLSEVLRKLGDVRLKDLDVGIVGFKVGRIFGFCKENKEFENWPEFGRSPAAGKTSPASPAKGMTRAARAARGLRVDPCHVWRVGARGTSKK
ncbi:hypothetical protein ACFX1W_016148 [Malus domestica]